MKRVRRALGLLFLLLSMGTFAKAEDPVDPGGGFQQANDVSLDPVTSPAVGKLKATGKYTEAKGWTCTKIDIEVFNNATGKLVANGGATLNKGVWAYSVDMLPSRINVTVFATATFTDGNNKQTKTAVPAGVTIR